MDGTGAKPHGLGEGFWKALTSVRTRIGKPDSVTNSFLGFWGVRNKLDQRCIRWLYFARAIGVCVLGSMIPHQRGCGQPPSRTLLLQPVAQPLNTYERM